MTGSATGISAVPVRSVADLLVKDLMTFMVSGFLLGLGRHRCRPYWWWWWDGAWDGATEVSPVL